MYSKTDAKLNLWNKAGWRQHLAVHAYCAFYGWNDNPPPSCSSKPSVRFKPCGAVIQTGRTQQLFPAKRVWAALTGRKASRLKPPAVTWANTAPPCSYYWSMDQTQPWKHQHARRGHVRSALHTHKGDFLLYPKVCNILQKMQTQRYSICYW